MNQKLTNIKKKVKENSTAIYAVAGTLAATAVVLTIRNLQVYRDGWDAVSTQEPEDIGDLTVVEQIGPDTFRDNWDRIYKRDTPSNQD